MAKRYYLGKDQIAGATLESVQRLAKWCGLQNAHEYDKQALCNYLQFEAGVVRPPYNAWGGMY